MKMMKGFAGCGIHFFYRVLDATKACDVVDPADEGEHHPSKYCNCEKEERKASCDTEEANFDRLIPTMLKMKAPMKLERASCDIPSAIMSAKARGVARPPAEA
nr:hypothetical protein [Neptunicoccus sediminis]